MAVALPCLGAARSSPRSAGVRRERTRRLSSSRRSRRAIGSLQSKRRMNCEANPVRALGERALSPSQDQIEATLKASGYPVGFGARASSDLMELSRTLRGEYAIDGKAIKTGAGNARAPRDANPAARRVNTCWRSRFRRRRQGPRRCGEDRRALDRRSAEGNAELQRLHLRPARAELRRRPRRMRDSDIEAYKNSVLSRICLLQAQRRSRRRRTRSSRTRRQILGDRFDESARAGEHRRRVQGQGRHGQGRRRSI